MSVKRFGLCLMALLATPAPAGEIAVLLPQSGPAAKAGQAVRDGLLPSVSVSDVEVTRDLMHANVFLTALVTEQGLAAVKDLNDNAWEFRKELARRMTTRVVPELHFKYDQSMDRGERIDALLRAPVVPVFAPKPEARAKTPAAKKAAVTKTAATKAPAAKKAPAKKAPAKKPAAKRKPA